MLKLLFTSQPLSIQVHPDDKFAHFTGLPNGKTEAWYVLSAAPGAKIALGLSRRLTPQQLRAVINDGSISELVEWRAVVADDVIFVPPGTIHAIGAGLVIAELQQRSDTTFRLFDYGRKRELHIEKAVAVAKTGTAHFQVQSNQLTIERRLFVSDSHFVFERIDLRPNSLWRLEADRETWLLVISGDAVVGKFDVVKGEVVFAQSDHVDIHAGASGMASLVAYAGGGLISRLLLPIAQPGSIDVGRLEEMPTPTSPTQIEAAVKNGRLEAIK